MAALLAISTMISLTMAQTTTLTLPFLGYDDTPIVASIVGANSAATTLQLACPDGTDASDCGLFPYQTLTYGPSTYKMDMSAPGDGFTMTQDCSIADSSAVCKESAGGSEANFPGSSTETYAGDEDMALTSLPVTVTKGAEKLTASAAATPTGSGSVAASTGSGASGTQASATKKSASGSTSGSATPSAEATGAAAANAMTLRVGIVGAAAGLFGGLFL